MAKILIASIGNTNYQKTCYKLGTEYLEDRSFSCELLIRVINPDSVYLVGTDSSIWTLADSCIGNGSYIPIKVPMGTTENEWWDMLHKMTDIRINKGDEIHLDITHSFRSLPLFSLLSLFYFEKIHDARIEGVYYGMFENKQLETVNKKEILVTPILELSPLLKLKDWLEGYSLFKNFGDTSVISRLLAEPARSPAIREFCDQLHRISNAFGFNHTKKIMDASEYFSKNEGVICRLLPLENKPAALIKEELFSVLKRFSPANFGGTVEIHLELIRWYLDHRRFIQAITLMRELVTTFFIEYLDHDKVFHQKFRNQVEQKLLIDKKLLSILQLDDTDIKFISKLSKERNRSAHSEMISVILTDRSDDSEQLVREYYEHLRRIVTNRQIIEQIIIRKDRIINILKNTSKKNKKTGVVA